MAVSSAPAGSIESFWRSKSLRVVVLTALMLGSFEGCLRVRAYWRHGRAAVDGAIFADDAQLGEMPKPGARMVSAGAVTTINQWGMRGADVPLAAAPGELRVLCLGASTTFGQPHDSDDEIWPARLEVILEERLGRPVTVLNGAMIGFTAAQSQVRLDRELARFDPDVAVIYHGPNHIAAHTRRQFGGNDAPAAWSAVQWFGERCLAYTLLKRNTAAWLAGQYQSRQGGKLDQRGVDAFEHELAALARDCQDRGYGVVMCTLPRAFDLDQSVGLADSALFFNPQLSLETLVDAYERYSAVVDATAREVGAVVADLDRRIPRGGVCFSDSVHFSTKGHERAAAVIAEAIVRMVESSGSEASSAHAVQ